MSDDRPLPSPDAAANPTRRDFLTQAGQSLVAVTALGGLAGCKAAASGVALPTRRARLVVSTWNFGQAANAAAWDVLSRGAEHPLDACEAGVRVSEADPAVSSVGYGGLPNAAGEVELDAAVMRGDTLACGGVAALRRILHPVSVARRVMERTAHVLMVGEGALAFARAQGFAEQDLLTPESRAAYERFRAAQPVGGDAGTDAFEEARRATLQGAPREDHDTIGLIALDNGRLATAVTTSGLAFKLPGRVGDSPIIGAGSYCDDLVGAAVSTGVGEEVIRTGGCVSIVEAMRRGLSPREAAAEVLARVRRAQAALQRQGDVAFLVVRRDGEVWGGSLLRGFQYAFTDAAGTALIDGEVLS
ncbi:MAG: N(4)-(beta-N-acetylglucosaminyl)-L-asparaginase [Planctomycetota bacterium]